MWEPILSGAGSVLGSLFGGQSNPYTSQAQVYGQYMPQIQAQYSPYIQNGQQSMQNYAQQTHEMMQNPSALQNSLMESYTSSPYANYLVDQATKGANRAAAAGGYLGTPQEQMELARQINGITSQDLNSYLNRGMDQYHQGLEGQQYLTNLGYGASSSLANALSQQAANQSNLAAMQQMYNNNRSTDLFSGLGTLAGGLADLFF